MKKIISKNCIALAILFLIGNVFANENDALYSLQHGWESANYQLDEEAKNSEFQNLITLAEASVRTYPDDARILIWSGIVKSSYAGVTGGIKALGLVKEAKNDLERAIAIDDESMGGSAYASLGTLYFSVPGWPISFGNDEKAEENLLRALSINPQSIDNNYFYGLFLLKQKRYPEAKEFLMRAKSSPPRPERPIADSERQKEIDVALKKLPSHES